MRILIVLIPVVLGSLELVSEYSSGIGWVLIGIGIYFLTAQYTGFWSPPKTGHVKFDWLSSLFFLFIAAKYGIDFLEGHQSNYLLGAIGFLLLGLSTIDVLIASVVAKQTSPSLQEVEKIVNTKFQAAFKYIGLGFILSSLVVHFG
ncbi:hypothetical protein DRW07_14800 [Alteromonas sediminis]|uniref:Uncharacterized protein n=1 Tax=Alteromonas sediminis TaxID=2259342 RepID=A0A3N5Y0M4_9ALTE|nr:hypothetical protein [Alteromonas sediminis]RPJ66066.1 hypothetical protein DRW07_14800 [Alteromonas sediminis]